MLPRSSIAICALAFISSFLTSIAQAHIVITYPGWRGDNLHTNGTVQDTNGLGVGFDSASNSSDPVYPYGMQWDYPCGGMPTSTNRTKWPIKGGAIAIQPGWFTGHATAFIYVNLGFGTTPLNMSFPMVPPFQMVGPTRDPYPGTFCLPQVPLPVNASVQIGDNATIQVIETAVHGAALYNCVDITFADPSEVAEVNESNCFNSSDLSFQLVFSTSALANAAPPSFSPSISSTPLLLIIAPLLLTALFGVLI